MPNQAAPSTKQQLVEATIESVHRYGLCDTSVATVTEIAGLSRGMVRHCFSSKNAMLVAAYESLHAEWAKVFFTHKTGKPLDNIIKMIESMFVPPNFSYLKVSAWVAFSIASLHDEELNQICRKDYSIWRNAIEQEICTHIESTGQDRDVDYCVTAILALSDGLWLRHVIEPDNVTESKARDTCVRLVYDLLSERVDN